MEILHNYTTNSFAQKIHWTITLSNHYPLYMLTINMAADYNDQFKIRTMKINYMDIAIKYVV